MAEFLNPFSGLQPGRALTKRELTRALRQALAAEEEAVHLYEALADAADDEVARAVLQDVADEERVHAGEFQQLLKRLLPDEQERLDEGAREVDEIAERAAGKPEQTARASSGATVGDLREVCNG